MVVGGVVLDIFRLPQAECHNVAPILCEFFFRPACNILRTIHWVEIWMLYSLRSSTVAAGKFLMTSGCIESPCSVITHARSQMRFGTDSQWPFLIFIWQWWRSLCVSKARDNVFHGCTSSREDKLNECDFHLVRLTVDFAKFRRITADPESFWAFTSWILKLLTCGHPNSGIF